MATRDQSIISKWSRRRDSNPRQPVYKTRALPLSYAAKAWLAVCPGDHTGPVCDPGALEYARRVVVEKKIPLPENCFRHSWISYRIALTGDKAATATEAGNSVKEIDRRYRVPLPRFKGEAWFALRPTN